MGIFRLTNWIRKLKFPLVSGKNNKIIIEQEYHHTPDRSRNLYRPSGTEATIVAGHARHHETTGHRNREREEDFTGRIDYSRPD